MRHIPDPRRPANAQFYREAQAFMEKVSPGKKWDLREIVTSLQAMRKTGVPTTPTPPPPTPAVISSDQYNFMRRMLGHQHQAQAVPPILGSGIIPAGTPYPVPEPKVPPALIAGPIIAWRLWKIRHDGILLSVAQAVAWPTGTPLEGIFEGGNYAGAGTRVGPGNTAGIYAMKTREHLGGQEYGRDCLVGQVALWGKVIEHEKGYRAEFAYPVMVDLEVKSPMPGFPRPKRRSELARMIRENYGCEVRE